MRRSKRIQSLKSIPAIQDKMREFEAQTGRPFTMFENDGDVVNFANKHGFDVRVRPTEDIVPQLRSLSAYGVDEAAAKQYCSKYRPHILTPKK